MEAQALATALEGEVAGHKAAIRRHRAGLIRSATELDNLRRECASRGIRLVSPKGEGEQPWPNPSSVSTP